VFSPADALTSVYDSSRVIAAGYTAEVSPDVENLLGRAPITFETFVADHLASWRQ